MNPSSAHPDQTLIQASRHAQKIADDLARQRASFDEPSRLDAKAVTNGARAIDDVLASLRRVISRIDSDNESTSGTRT